MTPRRNAFLVLLPCWLLVACLGLCADRFARGAEDASKPTTLAQLRETRKEQAHRKRRIIFNNDGCDAVYFCDEATPESLLKARTTGLLGKQVDTISYCTWSSGFGYFTHDTKIGDVFDCTEVGGAPNKVGFSNNKTGEFLKQGTDPLAIMVDFCKKNNIEIWWSMRMNDTHDRYGAWYSDLMYPPLKKKHPDWVIEPKNRRITAVDYGRQEIRDLALAFLREVCENYDVDGVDLDFYRHLLYFTCNAQGKDAGQAERDMMTDLMRRLRGMTEEVGLKRGRPILVSVRVPDSVPYCEAKGFDITRWLEEDLIDIMSVSGYVRFNPWETSAKLGHKYDVPVYPCLSETRMKQRGPRATIESYRARAVNTWAAGMDGVYVFNAFKPSHPLWNELGDPAALETLDKVFCTGARGVLPGYLNQWLANGARFLNRDPVSPERPRKLTPGVPVSIDLRVGQIDLRVGQEVRNREDLSLVPVVELQLLVSEAVKPADLSIKLNGELPPGGVAAKSGGWMEWAIDPQLVKKGRNQFEVTLAPHCNAKSPQIEDLLLWVRYKKNG